MEKTEALGHEEWHVRWARAVIGPPGSFGYQRFMEAKDRLVRDPAFAERVLGLAKD
jgi:hypothetical protein